MCKLTLIYLRFLIIRDLRKYEHYNTDLDDKEKNVKNKKILSTHFRQDVIHTEITIEDRVGNRKQNDKKVLKPIHINNNILFSTIL